MNALYWSLRRELWENRSIWLAPLGVACVMLVGFVITAARLPAAMAKAAALDPVRQHAQAVQPYDGVAVLLIVTTVIVGWFYCLDALYGERRDRSILFWKSLPVSDATTVIAKALVPLAILPAVAFVVIVAMQLVLLLLSTLVLKAYGMSAAALWGHVNVFGKSGVLLYGLAVLVLWQAPIYAWLLAVSAWAPRVPFLWATLPFLAICIVEWSVAGVSRVAHLLNYRLLGSYEEAFVVRPRLPVAAAMKDAASAGAKAAPHAWPFPVDPIPDPMKFLATPGLWLGLLAAVALIAAAIWLRRRRDPI